MDVTYNQEHLRLWNAYHIEIPMSGLANLGKEWNYPQTYFPFSRLYYILQGEGQLLFEDHIFTLKAGNVYLIPAGMTYGYNCPNHMEQLFFHTSYSYINGMDLFHGCNQICERSASASELAHLKRLYLSDSLADAFQLKAAVMKELTDFIVTAGLTKEQTKSYSAMVQQVFYLAQNPVTVNNRLHNLSEALHVAPSTLTKRFHQETGMTPGQYITQLVIGRACTLLMCSDLSIARIAEELGFSDQFYFTKYFKKQMHVTPSTYRKQIRG